MSVTQNKQQRGFTIVELLIVIVVIAILAAISIVAYNGIQSRTNDTVVKSDLRNFANKIMEYNAVNGKFPNGGGTNGPSGLEYSISRGSYATNVHNFIYCVNSGEGSDKFILTAASKSNKKFAYSSEKGLYDYTQNWGGVIDVCTNAGFLTGYGFSYGYRSDGVWWDWTR